MIHKKPIMQQFLNDRNRHELAGGFDYYKTGIKKLAEFKHLRVVSITTRQESKN
jgi:hypothetical protein